MPHPRQPLWLCCPGGTTPRDPPALVDAASAAAVMDHCSSGGDGIEQLPARLLDGGQDRAAQHRAFRYGRRHDPRIAEADLAPPAPTRPAGGTPPRGPTPPPSTKSRRRDHAHTTARPTTT